MTKALQAALFILVPPIALVLAAAGLWRLAHAVLPHGGAVMVTASAMCLLLILAFAVVTAWADDNG